MSNELIPYQDIEKMGMAVSKSGLFGLKTPEQAVALMLVAQALGKHPALAAMEYNIIQGRPAKKAEAIQADFQAAGGKIEWHCLTDDKAEATFSHPSGGSLRLDWTMDRAKKANLYDKDGSMYKKYPRQMLKARLVADGVRAVYPAAMGGVRAVEEMDDDPSVSSDNGKSRLENIIEEAEIVKPEDKKDATKKTVEPKKETKNVKKESKPDPVKEVEEAINGPVAPVELKEGEKLAQGFIVVPPKVAQIAGPDGKPTTKYSFTMAEANYGTFDKKLFNEICEIMDGQNKNQNQVLLNIVYTDRKKGDKTFHDIVRFEVASIGMPKFSE